MATPTDAARRRPTGAPAPSGQPAGGRVAPHNLEAEESLLGAMLLSRDAIAAAVEGCSSEDFYRPIHGHIFDAITTLYVQCEGIDSVTVANEFALAGLLDAVGCLAAILRLQAYMSATSDP